MAAAQITSLFMFDGTAEDAIRFYVSLFDDAEIIELRHYGPGEVGPEGCVSRGAVRLKGQRLLFIDSPVKHDFTFTPAVSLFVDCGDEAELDRLFTELSDEGQVLMRPANYPFSRKFAWLVDRFGLSWQLNLPFALEQGQ